MARTKGMLNLSGNLEVNAQAPLDARTIVPTEADLTVASNFPYPYVGLEVYVTGTDKKFRLTNLDTTQSSSWHEIGGGGGGETYSDFTGATASTAGAHGLVPAPSAGDEGKVLFGNGAWGALPSVDLSNTSVESDILDTTEKAVGTTTDGYLIYQKVVSTGGSVPSGATLLMRVQLLNSTDIIRYTKTTDSPLPSGVKFAGVTSTGEVIYEKNLLVPFAQSVAHGITNIGSYRRIADCGFILPDGVSYSPCYASPTLFVFPSGFTGTVVEFLYGTGWASTFQNIRLKLHFTLAS